MEQEEADLSQLGSLQPLEMSDSFETSSETSLGEIPLNIVRAMELTMVDQFGQCCEHYWSASSSISDYSLGSDHSLSFWSVDELTTCKAATSVDGFELFDEDLEGELEVLPQSEHGAAEKANCTAAQPSQAPEEPEGCSLSVQSVDALTTACTEAQSSQAPEELEGCSLSVQSVDALTTACTAAQPSQAPEELEGCSLSVQSVDALTTACTAAQPSQAPDKLEGCSLSVQSVDALTTACTAAQPSQAPERPVGYSFQKTLKRLFRQPLTPEYSPQVVPASANTSGADLDQVSDQKADKEPELPRHVKMFRALKKSFNKTFGCLGDRNMVQE